MQNNIVFIFKTIAIIHPCCLNKHINLAIKYKTVMIIFTVVIYSNSIKKESIKICFIIKSLIYQPQITLFAENKHMKKALNSFLN